MFLRFFVSSFVLQAYFYARRFDSLFHFPFRSQQQPVSRAARRRRSFRQSIRVAK